MIHIISKTSLLSLQTLITEVKTKQNKTSSVIRSLAGYSGIYRRDAAALSWFFSSKLGRPKMLSVTRMIHIISKTRVSRLFRSFVSPDACYWSEMSWSGSPIARRTGLKCLLFTLLSDGSMGKNFIFLLSPLGQWQSIKWKARVYSRWRLL